MNQLSSPIEASSFFIRFVNLFDAGRALAFPCDERGSVDLDTLSEQARTNYLFARAMVGRDFSPPQLLARLAEGNL
jgi:hypothetical protein